VRCGTCLAERKYLKAKQDRTVILMNNLTSVSSKLNINIDTVSRKNFYLCVIINYFAITLEKCESLLSNISYPVGDTVIRKLTKKYCIK